MNNYFIKSERLGFSTWTKEKFLLAKELWGDINVTRLIDSRGKLDDNQIFEKLNYEIENYKKYGIQYYPIFLLDNNEFVGCCGLKPYDLDKGVYEIGFHIVPKHWKKGIAKESAKRIIKYAFVDLKANELFAGHNPNNIGSKKLLHKLGFKYVGVEFFEPTGLNHPSYRMKRNTTYNNEVK